MRYGWCAHYAMAACLVPTTVADIREMEAIFTVAVVLAAYLSRRVVVMRPDACTNIDGLLRTDREHATGRTNRSQSEQVITDHVQHWCTPCRRCWHRGPVTFDRGSGTDVDG